MAYREIIRVRKGKEYRQRLSKEQHVVVPEHPARLIALEDAELDNTAGGGSVKGDIINDVH
jgi:mersacidin/lichenicidin family type 2 lantibiotic